MAIGRSRSRGHRSAAPTERDGAEGACLVRVVEGGDADCAPAGTTPGEALELAARGDGRMAVLLYPDTTSTAVQELADAWDLHPVLVEDLEHGGQRPKLERYGDVLFLVVRSAHYDDAREQVDLAEFHVLVRPGAVAILCQDGLWFDGTPASALVDPDSAAGERAVAALLEGELTQLGPEAVAYRLVDRIVDGYVPVLQGVAVDKDEIEKQVFSADPAVAERIYRLSQEVIDLQHATSWLIDVLASLRGGFVKHQVPEELQTYLQDVADHLDRVSARIAEYREALAQILNVNATLVAQRQNEDMKKISGWAAILFAPTLIAAIYGMNFDAMPELHWSFGYPLAVVTMVGFSVALYFVFKAKKWM
ncbi:magnesium and cobalt transport protein CorA [Demequina sp. NBRC 110056]|uniref:magnesium and cobalt transport protein CorA n=1 Tax=Demequina sp. NBRC 110056 TaxID=1570345 RepID=UPI001F2DC369|nr:magnesium and cobalt transport protein CorA [Demequina sp. NBRC 110056]